MRTCRIQLLKHNILCITLGLYIYSGVLIRGTKNNNNDNTIMDVYALHLFTLCLKQLGLASASLRPYFVGMWSQSGGLFMD